MKIIYVSCTCSNKTYGELFGECDQKPGQQAQKYHRLFAEGLSKTRCDIEVEMVTALPLTKKTSKMKYFPGGIEYEDGIKYVYIPIINRRVVRNVFAVITCFITVLRELCISKDCYIICDVLNVSAFAGAVLASKIKKCRCIGIITDLPEMLTIKKSIVNICNFLIQQCSGYVLLTEDMNQVINKKKKPYVVLEGHVDISMEKSVNDLKAKYEKRTCIYAGAIHKRYGIEMLVKAFIKCDNDAAELHVYGDGDYREELMEMCKKYPNIKYYGVKLNDEIVREEIRAAILINPRPTKEAFTRYSFPSKNMEYMASGTPVLTTRLPGMPKEYYGYVYLFEEESIEGFAETLNWVLCIPIEELHTMGSRAKEFVLKHKNNVMQAQKVIKLLREF